MGKIKQGILGGFSGKTGAVVGSSWKGIAYMRGKAQSIKNPRTSAQQTNRNNFGVISDHTSLSLEAVNIGFKSQAVKQSAFNACVKKNMENNSAVSGEINPVLFIYSEGNMQGVSGGTLQYQDNMLNVSLSFVETPTTAGEAVTICLVNAQNLARPLVMVKKFGYLAEAPSISGFFNIPADLENMEIAVSAFLHDTATDEVSNSSFVGGYPTD